MLPIREEAGVLEPLPVDLEEISVSPTPVDDLEAFRDQLSNPNAYHISSQPLSLVLNNQSRRLSRLTVDSKQRGVLDLDAGGLFCYKLSELPLVAA